MGVLASCSVCMQLQKTSTLKITIHRIAHSQTIGQVSRSQLIKQRPATVSVTWKSEKMKSCKTTSAEAWRQGCSVR